MSGNQNRAKLLPGSKDGQPIIMWDGEPVHFPVQDELVLHATEGGTPPPPQAKVIAASGLVLCTYERTITTRTTSTRTMRRPTPSPSPSRSAEEVPGRPCSRSSATPAAERPPT